MALENVEMSLNTVAASNAEVNSLIAQVYDVLQIAEPAEKESNQVTQSHGNRIMEIDKTVQRVGAVNEMQIMKLNVILEALQGVQAPPAPTNIIGGMHG